MIRSWWCSCAAPYDCIITPWEPWSGVHLLQHELQTSHSSLTSVEVGKKKNKIDELCRTPLSSFVSTGKNSRSIAVVLISVGFFSTPTSSQTHWSRQRRMSPSSSTNVGNPPHNQRTPHRTPQTFHIDETRSVLPNLSCGKIVDCSHCIGKTRFRCHLSSECEYLLLHMSDNLLHRHRSSSNWGTAISPPAFHHTQCRQITKIQQTKSTNEHDTTQTTNRATIPAHCVTSHVTSPITTPPWWKNMTVCQMTGIVFLNRSRNARQCMVIRTDTALGQDWGQTTLFVCTSCTVWHCRKQVWILTRHQNLKKKLPIHRALCTRKTHNMRWPTRTTKKTKLTTMLCGSILQRRAPSSNFHPACHGQKRVGISPYQKNGHLLEDGGGWVTCRASCHKSNHVNDSKITKISCLNGGMRPLKSRCSFFSCFSFCWPPLLHDVF